MIANGYVHVACQLSPCSKMKVIDNSTIQRYPNFKQDILCTGYCIVTELELVLYQLEHDRVRVTKLEFVTELE